MAAGSAERRVHYGVYPNSTRKHPVIRMRGKHLERWGFRPGDRIRVSMAPGRIVIRKA